MQPLLRSAHKQLARAKGHDRSTLTRNLNKRRIVVHTTPLAGINYLSTSRHGKKQEQDRGRKRTGNFHCKGLRMVDPAYTLSPASVACDGPPATLLAGADQRPASVRRFSTDGLRHASCRATRDGGQIDYVLKR